MRKAEEEFRKLLVGKEMTDLQIAEAAHWFSKGYIACIPEKKEEPGHRDFMFDPEAGEAIRAEIKGWNDCRSEIMR